MNVREKYFATQHEIKNNGLTFLNINLKTIQIIEISMEEKNIYICT